VKDFNIPTRRPTTSFATTRDIIDIVLYNRHYETFEEFKTACEDFFRHPRRYRRELLSLLTENFPIIASHFVTRKSDP